MPTVIQIKKPEDILYLFKRWKNKRQENFLAITLDGAHQIIKVHHVSMGTANKSMIHPRECFYPAIKDNAVAIIFAHNHPSGQAEPSEEDQEATERLCMAGSILGFHILDHIIFTKNNNIYSFARNRKIGSGYDLSQLKRFAGSLAAEKEP